jgi:hypothetical protein
MARRSRGLGLSAYFDFTVFDTNIAAIRETRSRVYLERRLAQVDVWLGYLSGRVEDRYRRGPSPALSSLHTSDTASAVLDVVYLQAVRRAIQETLRTL